MQHPVITTALQCMQAATLCAVVWRAVQVVTVPEESGTADALRAVAPQLTAPSVVVYSGDIVTDLHLPAVLLEHQVGL